MEAGEVLDGLAVNAGQPSRAGWTVEELRRVAQCDHAMPDLPAPGLAEGAPPAEPNVYMDASVPLRKADARANWTWCVESAWQH